MPPKDKKRTTTSRSAHSDDTDSDDKPTLKRTKRSQNTQLTGDSDDHTILKKSNRSKAKSQSQRYDDDDLSQDSDDKPLKKTKSVNSTQDHSASKGSKNTKQAREQARLQRQISDEQKDDAPAIDSDESISALASALLQSADPTLKETHRLAKTMKSAKLRRAVLPVVPEENEVAAATLLQHQPVPGRNVVPKRVGTHKKDKCWIFYFEDRGSVKALHSKEGEIRVNHLYLPETATVAEQTTLHQELARIYNTWPYLPLSETGRTITFRQWIVIAFSNISRRQQEIFAPTIQGSNYCITMHYFDPETGDATEATTHVSPADTAMAHVTIPSVLPDIYLRTGWTTGKRKLPLVTASNPEYLGPPKKMKVPSSTASQRKCQDALRWISLQLTGMVTSPERMDKLISIHREMVGLDSKTATGVYGNEGPLYYVEPSKSTGQLFVVPSAVVKRDIVDTGTSKWHIVINSLNASRATPVLDSLIQNFCAGDDIRHVWIDAAKVADEVNLAIGEGTLPSLQCDCDEAHVSVELHACGRCARPAICATRSFDNLGRLVCPKCQARDQAVHGGRRTNETLMQYMVRITLTKSFYRECKARQVDPLSSDSKSTLKAALADVVGRCSDDQPTSYRCAYSGGQYDAGEERPLIGDNPSRRRVVPHSATVDAGLPEGEPQWHGFKHSPGNLEIVTFACQFAKYTYLPGALHVIGEYLRKTKEAQSTKEDEEKLLVALFDMTLVALKRAHLNKNKVPADEEERYKKVKAEMLCGKPTPGEHGPWEKQARRYTGGRVPSPEEGLLWDDTTYRRSQKCAESIGKFFDVDIPKLQDGTYWPHTWGIDETVHRNGIALLCRERLTRMRLMCNKKWETQDTEESLYAEVIFQYCASRTKKKSLRWLKDKYGDRLGLPLTIWINSPLRFSIAHRVHGFGMFSRWPPEPTDVQERIDNDHKNNMLSESGYVNFGKQDVAEDYYSDMDEIYRKVDLGKNGMTKYYDPTQSPPAEINSTFANMQPVELEDFEAILFDDDELQGFIASVEEKDATDDGEEDGSAGDGAAEGESQADDPLDMIPDDSSPEDMRARTRALRSIVLDDENAREIFRDNPRVAELLSTMQTMADANEKVAFRAADDEIDKLLFPE